MKGHFGHDPAAAGPERRRAPRSPADHSGHGHLDQSGHAAEYRRRFWITLILAVPVVVYSEMIQDWFGFTAPQFPGDDLVAPLLGTVIFVYGAPFS